MNAEQARRLLLVGAHEGAGPTPDWREADRDWASHEAWRIEGAEADPDTWLHRRTDLAVARLAERQPAVAALLAWCPIAGWHIGWLLALALLAGMASNLVAPDRQIQLLAPPLLALLAWNILVYGLLAWQALLGLGRRARGTGAGPLQRMLLALGARTGLWGSRQLATSATALSPALQAFAHDWARLSLPLQIARLGTAMHLAAAALAAGAVAGLYLRGLAFEFRAGWDSTFLDANAVHGLLSFVLGPAAWLTGQTLPDAAQLEGLRFSRGGGQNAGPWIHLYALTTTLVVLLPRGLLAAWSGRRAARLRAHFPMPVDDPWLRRLRQQAGRRRGAPPLAVAVQPVGYQVDPGLVPAIAAALEAEWARGVAITLQPSRSPADDGLAAPSGQRVLLFAMTATPEAESHGRLLSALARAGAQGRDAADGPLLAIVDESGFRRRLAPADLARRLDERRGAWRRLLEAGGHRPVFVDLAAPPQQP